MKLLYFTTAYERGLFGNRVHEEFLARLIEIGHAPAVFVPNPRDRGRPRVRIEPGSPAVIRPAVSAGPADRLANRLSGRLVHYNYFATTLAAYRAHLRANRNIDLVHVESVYPLGAIAALAGDSRPFVPTIRGGDLIADDTIGYGFARFRSVRLLLRMAFHRAAVVRAVSPGARAMAIRFGCPPEKIAVVPRNIREDCFVDDVPAFRAACRREIAARHGLEDRTIIVAAGRLLPVKGFDDLVRAMPRLLAELPTAVALICGPNRVDPQVGDYRAYLERLAREVGVGQHVILTGQIAPERMASYLAAADAVAVPSLIEGGNKILVEGAALGTPFVATDTSGTIGFFTASEGVSVPTRQPERLAVALIELLADRTAWERRSAACLAGRARFHSRSVVAAMQQVYQRAIDHHTLARPGSPSIQTRRES